MKKTQEEQLIQYRAATTMKQRAMIRAWWLFKGSSWRAEWWGVWNLCLKEAWRIEKEGAAQQERIKNQPKSVVYSEKEQNYIRSWYASGANMGD